MFDSEFVFGDLNWSAPATEVRVSVGVPAALRYFDGHFPVRPVMPGVLIIEAMAQTAAVLVVETLDLMDSDRLVYFMSIEGAKFRQPVVPGDQLELHVEVIRGKSKVWKFNGTAKIDGRICAEAVFTAMIMSPEEAGAKV